MSEKISSFFLFEMLGITVGEGSDIGRRVGGEKRGDLLGRTNGTTRLFSTAVFSRESSSIDIESLIFSFVFLFLLLSPCRWIYQVQDGILREVDTSHLTEEEQLVLDEEIKRRTLEEEASEEKYHASHPNDGEVHKG